MIQKTYLEIEYFDDFFSGIFRMLKHGFTQKKKIYFSIMEGLIMIFFLIN